MTTKKIKEMLDACYQAKRIREMLPPLPQGVMPSYIQYLDAIQKLEKKDIPLLILDGDGMDRRNSHDGQIRTRFEAFLEVLKQRKEEA